jgi:hypothetical protein
MGPKIFEDEDKPVQPAGDLSVSVMKSRFEPRQADEPSPPRLQAQDSQPREENKERTERSEILESSVTNMPSVNQTGLDMWESTGTPPQQPGGVPLPEGFGEYQYHKDEHNELDYFDEHDRPPFRTQESLPIPD